SSSTAVTLVDDQTPGERRTLLNRKRCERRKRLKQVLAAAGRQPDGQPRQLVSSMPDENDDDVFVAPDQPTLPTLVAELLKTEITDMENLADDLKRRGENEPPQQLDNSSS
ncbi:unnamed protein product, partial [Didymodactylos carnosus]